jgi:membrane protease YdiL (CAAX protease family)
VVDPDRPPQHIVALAFVFEGGLGAAALLLGWLLGRWPLPGVQFSGVAWTAWAGAIAAGAVAAGPMLLLLLVVERFPGGPFRELKRIVDELVVPLFARCRLWEMAGISLIAGIGEELLFRGLLQQGLADWLGPPRGVWLALLVSSLLFGVGHWLCTGYAVLAAVIGAYLGLLLIGTGNLLVPATAHALYDFVALVYLVKWKPCRC